MEKYLIYLGDIMQDKLHMMNHPGINPEPFISKITGINDNSIYLKETYCYPRGGGQPGDIGILVNGNGDEINFYEVLPGEFISHPVKETNNLAIGEEVTCIIDVNNRNQNTRMHTAQHIFSAIAEDLWGAETVGNQLGPHNSRIDLKFENKELFDQDELISNVNEIINSSKSVKVHNWNRNKILDHPQIRHTKFINRIPTSITELRVVEIVDIDLCPCAGTHVSNTSDIPHVRFISKKNKGKGRIRISYEFE